MTTQGKWTVVVLSLLLVVMGVPVLGEEVGPAEEKWGFTVAPYLWMTSMKGDVTIRGVTGKVDATFGDLLDDLDVAGSLVLGARKGVWGVFLDAYYAKVSADGEVLDNPAEVTVKNTFLDLGVTRQLYEGPWYSQGNRLWWDFRAAARYYDVDGELDIEGGPRESGDQDWIDPMIGLVMTTEVGEQWLLKLRGDIGGFGIGSRFAWDLRFLVGYSLSKNANLWVGWEHREMDYDTGSGDDEFEYDLYYTGPILGASFHF